MKIYQKFLSKKFFKNFLILFFALEIFFTGIDLMQNFKYLPDSANLQIIYAVNMFLTFMNYTLPLSLVFAMISTIFGLIKSNELVAIYSLGASKNDIIKPIFLISLLATIFYVALGFTPFMQAKDKAYSIKKRGTLSSYTENLFLKSGEDYIAIKELFVFKKEANDIKIFKTENGNLREIIDAKKAYFKGDHWELENVLRSIKPDISKKDAKMKFENLKSLSTLEGFKPKIIDNLFKGEGQLTIQDSFSAMDILKKEHINSDKLRAHLYIMIAFPFFAPIVILGLFYPLPMQRRSANMALLSSVYIFSTLIIWGLLFTMSKISLNGALSPEMGILFPLLLLLFGSIFLMYKKRL
jgi:lipopolysaccharide export system permease protein